MKKLRTNAQVTSIVCIMESIIAAFCWIALSQTIYWVPGFTAWILFPCLHLVILPYFFLMNTSHNKERVIEHGWKNVFKNLLGNKWYAFTNFCIRVFNKDYVSTISIPQESLRNFEDNKGLQTFSSLKIADLPSTSKGKYEPEKYFRPPTASDTLSDASNECGQTENIEMLVSKMFKYIHDEDEYIKHLRQLVLYLPQSQDKELHTTIETQNGFLPNSVPDVYRQRRTTACKGRKSNQGTTESYKNPTITMILSADRLENSVGNKQFIGNKVHRTNIRDTLLQEIHSNFGDKEKRDLLIEQLVEEEEKILTGLN